ncbi:hypothetical protein HANVADRAFT_53225 [Hanseniaspora valbyensis NRRL Y-1626]|uniref:Trs120/TRAPPC9 N-terminal domain-containing protein n=1 Tax=Hanseniaspora valbyensis NRRL Y-1626 TaxID=766949 RepID=A0A1B7TCE7_9ASCO|nr:hypothetical protein HANVADRAFT_53225 [Hanseniaspora valbyensis NRRL Y-1626]
MLNHDLVNDITSIKVCVKLNIDYSLNSLELTKILKHKLQLQDLIPFFKSNSIEEEEDETHLFNPSHFPQSFIKFDYYLEDEINENDDNDLLLYHDLEPWRNTFVKLIVEKNIDEKTVFANGSIEENIYCKAVTIDQLNDIKTYHDIASNTFEILKNYYKSLKYLKLRSPSDILVNSEEPIKRVNFQNNNISENSNTYYQWTKAKYKMNNIDLNIQIQSRIIKFKANLLILAGQYKTALKFLNDCIIQFYKNGDFLWLANSLEMIIFVILNLIALSNTMKEGEKDVIVPTCVNYLIDYDKHCICKDKIVKKIHTTTHAIDKNSLSANGVQTPRNSSDAHSLPSRNSESFDTNIQFDPSKKHVIFPQALPLLISNIYDKLIHYCEYTSNEEANFLTPIIFNNTVINYLNFLHLSIKIEDFNKWLNKMTDIEITNFEPNYLQPMQTDLQFQLQKFSKINLINNLPIYHSLRWINLQTSFSDTLSNKRNLIFLVYQWISDNIDSCDFSKARILDEPIESFVYQLILNNLENQTISRKLIMLVLTISSDSNLINKICEIGLRNYENYNSEEQSTLIKGIETWPSYNESLLVSSEVLERNINEADLPVVELLKNTDDEKEFVKDEVFNPFRNKDYSRTEKLPIIEHAYIKNEIISLNLHFRNYYNIDLLINDINVDFPLKEFFEIIDFESTILAARKITKIEIKIKCLMDYSVDTKEIDKFVVKIAEFKNDTILMKILKKPCIHSFKILPEQPLLKNPSTIKSIINFDTFNKCDHLIKNLNTTELEIFNIAINVNNKEMNPLIFFNKKKVNIAETQLYDHMIDQLKQSIKVNYNFVENKDVKLDISLDFMKFQIAHAHKIDIIIKYGLIKENIKYISSLTVPWNLQFNEKLIVTNLEIIPFNTIPSEQISLGEISNEDANVQSKESWMQFIEKNHDFKWLLLLNIRNISKEEIVLKYSYDDIFKSEEFLIDADRNRRVIIPIESSLFDNNTKNGKNTAYNILMNFNNLIHLFYGDMKNFFEYKMNLLSNIKLEDCYNSQKLVNRNDISIYLSKNENILSMGQTATIVLKPGTNIFKNKIQNVLVSLMVIDTITGEDVLQDDKNTVLLNGMRTFNIDGNQEAVTIDCIFLIPGNYEINCLCEIGDDPSRVVKFFSTRAFNVRVVQ